MHQEHGMYSGALGIIVTIDDPARAIAIIAIESPDLLSRNSLLMLKLYSVETVSSLVTQNVCS